MNKPTPDFTLKDVDGRELAAQIISVLLSGRRTADIFTDKFFLGSTADCSIRGSRLRRGVLSESIRAVQVRRQPHRGLRLRVAGLDQ
jgi:hypothetical protein